MKNNYFEYQDFVKVDKADLVLSTSAELQEGSDIEQLRYGVMPYDFASFEENAYVTSSPKILAKPTDKLGFLTANTTDADGSGHSGFSIDLGDSYTVSGITLGMVNLPSSVLITYRNASGDFLNEKYFFPTKKLQFLNFVAGGVHAIDVSFEVGTTKPHHFLGVYRIELGSLRVFDEKNLISAEVNSHFSVDGSTIEYDTANLKIFHEDDVEYAFLKKQPVIYKDVNGNVINEFFIESGESENEYISTLKAYDSIANLEGTFLGGKYGFGKSQPYPVKDLLVDILGDTDVKYSTAGIDNISVSGYIPICTKRKALALLCRGANIRCFKSGGRLVFEPLNFGGSVEYTNSEIVENPIVKRNQSIGKLTILQHDYENSNEEIELYNWYLQKGDNTEQIVEFSRPVWKVIPYEVTGTDEEIGIDIVEPSTNVTFLEYPTKSNNVANYVKIGKNSTSNKIILKGYLISDSKTKIVAGRYGFDVNAEYEDVSIEDVTIVKSTFENEKIKKQTQEIANTLFAIENSRVKQTIEVVDVDMPRVGVNVKTSLVSSPLTVVVANKNETATGITRNMKIASVKDDLSGVYEVVIE